MEIIKEKWVNKECDTVHIIIRTNCYTSRFDHFVKLKEILDIDFPNIELNSEIVQYKGKHYKGTFGLETRIPINSVVPKEYKKIKIYRI